MKHVPLVGAYGILDWVHVKGCEMSHKHILWTAADVEAAKENKINLF